MLHLWFREASQNLSSFRQLFFHSFQGGTKGKMLKNQCIVLAIFQDFSFGPPLETMKKSCLNELKFWEASRNQKWSICWKFQLSISLGTQKVSHVGIHIWESCSPFCKDSLSVFSLWFNPCKSLFTLILIGLFNVCIFTWIYLVFVFYPFTAVDTLFWKWICSNNIKRTIFSIDSSNFISEHLVHYWNSLFKLWMRNWISYWRNTKTTWNKFFFLLLVYRINALSELQS